MLCYWYRLDDDVQICDLLDLFVRPIHSHSCWLCSHCKLLLALNIFISSASIHIRIHLQTDDAVRGVCVCVCVCSCLYFLTATAKAIIATTLIVDLITDGALK